MEIKEESVITSAINYSLLTDYYTANALLSTGKRIHNLPTFPVNPSRFITLKLGKTIYILFNNGTNPFCESKVDNQTILLYPDEYSTCLEIFMNHKEKTVENLNVLLTYGRSSPVTTIPISENIPRCTLGRKSRSGRDIRIIVPCLVYDLYQTLEVFDLRKLERKPPSILMNKLTLAIAKRSGYCDIIFNNRMTQLEFKGYKWFELLLFGGYKIKSSLIGLNDVENIYCFDLPAEVQNIKNSDTLLRILRGEFRLFEQQYQQVSYFKINHFIVKRGDPEFQEIINNIFEFKFICMGMFLPTNYHLIIFDIFPNNLGFHCERKFYQFSEKNKLESEIEKNAKKLLKEEEHQKEIAIAKENAKKAKEILRQKEKEEMANIAKKKSILKKIAIEAKNIAVQKEVAKKKIQRKIVNDIIQEIFDEVTIQPKFDLFNPMESKSICPSVSTLFANIYEPGWDNPGDEFFYCNLLLNYTDRKEK